MLHIAAVSRAAVDGVLHILLLKRNRRGHYAVGSTNADTFWMSLLAKAPSAETLQLQHPPTR